MRFENVKTFTPTETILQLLCRSFKTLSKPGQTVGLGTSLLMLAVWGQALAQTTPVNPGWATLAQGAKQFVVESYKVDPESVLIQPMDHRIKFEACTQAISFDQPFGNKQSVRARCASPVWQHFVMVQTRSSLNTGAATAPSNTATRLVWVSTQSLKRGTPVQANMFKVIEQAVPAHETRFIQDERELANAELVRDLPANTPLKWHDLKAATMVKRGQQVTVAVGEGKGFLITLRAEAQQDGILGDQIRLKNPESGRSLTAVVTGVNMARGL